MLFYRDLPCCGPPGPCSDDGCPVAELGAMRLYVGIKNGASGAERVEAVEWDGLPPHSAGAYAGLLGAVGRCAGFAGPPPSAVLYYVDLSDADEIAVRTDEDVAEFVDHHRSAGRPPTIHVRTTEPPLQQQQPQQRGAAEKRASSSEAALRIAPPGGESPQPTRTGEGAAVLTPEAASRCPGASGILTPVGRRVHSGGFPNLRCGHLLGAGATGKVYKAFDAESGEFLAVKQVLLHGNEDNLRAVRREIALMRPLQHPNIVSYKGIQQTTTALHILMEFVPGGSISSLLAKLGRFSEHVIRAYTCQVCQGLKYLHDNGIIHRDIKGGNCLVGVDGSVKLADFGCSVRVYAAPGGGMPRPSGSLDGRLLGTSMWMSPEAVRAPQGVTFATDIWSVGCTVVEMGSARPPWADAHFTNEWAAMFYISQTNCGPPVPRHLSRQAHDLLGQCFAIDPEQRPTVSGLLAHGFITEPFEDRSEKPSLQPPSDSELLPAPQFPSAAPASPGGHGTGDLRASVRQSLVGGDDVASVASFAPMDLRDSQWPHLEEDDMVLCAHDDDADVDTDADGRLIPADSATSGLSAEGAALPSPDAAAESPRSRRAAQRQQQRTGEGGGTPQLQAHRPAPIPAAVTSPELAPAPPVSPVLPPTASRRTPQHEPLPQLMSPLAGDRLPELRHCALSSSAAAQDAETHEELEEGTQTADAPPVASAFAITEFLQQQGQAAAVGTEYAVMGLPEGVVYNALFFMDALSLCRVAQCSRQLRQMVERGNGELCWKKLFASEFGEVSIIQGALRKNWKMHYAISRRWSREVLKEGRFFFWRMLTFSPKVFEGVDSGNGDTRVVLKVEPVTRRLRPTGGGVRSPASTYALPPGAAGPTPRKGPTARSGMLLTSSSTASMIRGGGGRASAARPGSGPVLAGYTGPIAQGSPMKNFHTRHQVLPAASFSAADESQQQQQQHGAGGRPHSGPQGAAPAAGGVPPPASAPAGRITPAAPAPRWSGQPAANRPLIASAQQPHGPGPPVQGTGPPPQGLIPSSPQLPLPLPTSRSPSKRQQWPRRASGTSPGRALTTPGAPPAPAHSAAMALQVGGGQQRASHLAPLPSASRPAPALSADDAAAAAGGAPLAAATLAPERHRLASGGGFAATQTEATTMGDLVGFSATAGAAGAGRSQWDAYEYITEQDRQEQRRKDERQLQTSALVQYYKVAKELADAGVTGVLPPIWFGQNGDSTAPQRQRREVYNVLVMPPAGPSLNDLLLCSGNHFNCKTVALIALKALRILRDVHEHGVIHCNVAPSNLLVGSEEDPSKLYLINWSCARHWRDRKARRFVSSAARAVVRVRGSEHVYFASPQVQMECTPSPRDDLVSLAYCLYYFLHGGLPWIPLPSAVGPQPRPAREVIAMKKRFLKDIQDVRPVQLFHFLNAVLQMRANDMPDYPFLENIFRKLMAERGYVDDDIFEWSHKLVLGV
eukprot:TRINITY_DN1871_c1_g2_i2.p1 TRINITY_DN1871_c1_g2~~TRINITY_DN1871_c1_g2_i2.p1  ORF type:complete len:1463 (+),score=378.60 TRINITY_DN1871_c1_g2_i2:35-4423(+)